MHVFNPVKPVTETNYAIRAEFGWFGENIIRECYFGSAKEFAEWLDAFDYKSGDVFEWSGDSATMKAVDSYRKEREWPVPEFITEFNTNDGTSEIIGADAFHNLRRMFQRDRDYVVFRHFAENAKVYSVMYRGNGAEKLSSYVWHVPFGADELPIS